MIQEKKKLKTNPNSYVIHGRVVHGKGEGAKHQLPTLNIDWHKDKELPPNGVYASMTWIDGKNYLSITNIGLRPSVDTMQTITVETHLIDCTGDFYGKDVMLEIKQFIRPTKKFEGGLDEVVKQVTKDIEKVKELYAKEINTHNKNKR